MFMLESFYNDILLNHVKCSRVHRHGRLEQAIFFLAFPWYI